MIHYFSTAACGLPEAVATPIQKYWNETVTQKAPVDLEIQVTHCRAKAKYKKELEDCADLDSFEASLGQQEDTWLKGGGHVQS